MPDFAIRSDVDDTWLLFIQSDLARLWAREHLADRRERCGSAIVIPDHDVRRLVHRVRRAGLRVQVVAPTLRRFAVEIGAMRSATRIA